MQALRRDLWHALRSLRRSGSHVAIIVATVGLAIGASTTVFSLFNAIFMRPLPLRAPERLMLFWEAAHEAQEMPVAYPNYLDWRQRQTTFDDLAAFQQGQGLLLDQPVSVVNRIEISANLLEVGGISPTLGRNFTATDDQLGGAPVALVSEGLWRTRYASIPDVIGRWIRIDEKKYRVVGVVPQNKLLEGNPELAALPTVYTPIGQNWRLHDRNARHAVKVIGHIKQGVDLAHARREFERIGKDLQKQFPDTIFAARPMFKPIEGVLFESVRLPLWITLAASVLLLGIGLANATSLTLMRGLQRRRQTAVMSALGLSRRQLVRQALAESAIVFGVSGLVGILIAKLAVEALKTMRMTAEVAKGQDFSLDLVGIAFAVCLSLLGGLVAAVAPALKSSTIDPNSVLKAVEASAVGQRKHRWIGAGFAAGQMALAFLVLYAAGLSLHTLKVLHDIDLGFDATNVTVANAQGFPQQNCTEGVSLRTEFLRQLRQHPALESAALSSSSPLQSNWHVAYELERHPWRIPGAKKLMSLRAVTPDYFAVYRIGLVSGRVFKEEDSAEHSEPVAIIDERMMRTLAPGVDLVGTKILVMEKWRTIVGVVRHTKEWGLDQPEYTDFQAYVPLISGRSDDFPVAVSVRALGSANVPAVLEEVMSRLSPDQSLWGSRAMQSMVDDTTAHRRFIVFFLLSFAMLATLLTAVGLYAVISQNVRQQTREIGIRMALGTSPQKIRLWVFSQLGPILIVGLGIGFLLTLALRRVLQSVAYGFPAADATTFGAVFVFLAVIAFVACYLPAQRAARIDPTTVLRAE